MATGVLIPEADVQGNGAGRRLKPAKLMFTVAPSTLARLKELAAYRGVRIAEIVRWALTIYSHIEDAKQHNSRARVLLDRGDGKPLELVLPF